MTDSMGGQHTPPLQYPTLGGTPTSATSTAVAYTPDRVKVKEYPVLERLPSVRLSRGDFLSSTDSRNSCSRRSKETMKQPTMLAQGDSDAGLIGNPARRPMLKNRILTEQTTPANLYDFGCIPRLTCFLLFLEVLLTSCRPVGSWQSARVVSQDEWRGHQTLSVSEAARIPCPPVRRSGTVLEF